MNIMVKLGKALLFVVSVALVTAGIVAAWYSSVLFQQNVKSLEKMQQIMSK